MKKRQREERQQELESSVEETSEESSEAYSSSEGTGTTVQRLFDSSESSEEEPELKRRKRDQLLVNEYGEGLEESETSDEDMLTTFEAESKKRREKRERIEEENIREMRDEKIEEKVGLDMHDMEVRLQEVLKVLKNYGAYKSEERDRQSYVQELKQLLSLVYDTSEWLVEKYMQLFTIHEMVAVFEANDQQRPFTIRVNTLKIKRKELARILIGKGVNVSPLEGKYFGEVLQVFESPIPLGATPEYLAGLYMIQAAASILPVSALQVETGMRVLDMCAAPGGKAAHIGAHLRHTGCLWANDASGQRATALTANLQRLGITQAFVTVLDGRLCCQIMESCFDRVLLDAPCTGTGILSRDPGSKLHKGPGDLKRCTGQQRQLILAAFDSLAVGGVLVYSTCSILVEENEAIVDYLLRRRNAKIAPFFDDFGCPGKVNFMSHSFHPSVKHCVRVYPHMHNLDGFFVARIEKVAGGVRATGLQALGGEAPKKHKKNTLRKKIRKDRRRQQQQRLAQQESDRRALAHRR